MSKTDTLCLACEGKILREIDRTATHKEVECRTPKPTDDDPEAVCGEVFTIELPKK